MSAAPEPAARPGDPVSAIDTPALVVDLDAMDRNLDRMSAFARKHGVRWRAHAKMHKSAELALRQMRAGAVGVCVQKVAEAQALAAGGVTDLYISNQVLGSHKLALVAALAHELAARGGRLAIAVDSMAGIDGLAQALAAPGQRPPLSVVDVFVEIDVGQGRCGVSPGAAAVPLALAVAQHPMLRFAGLQAYQGRAQHVRHAGERANLIDQAVRHVQATCAALASAGLTVPLITGAGTGTLACEAASGLWGELQPGSFLFMDADYALNDTAAGQPAFEQALFVRSQVISRSAAHAVCDAGHKSHAIDSGLPQVHALAGQPALRYANGGDEHGLLHPAEPGGHLPALGDAVWLIPGHCDPTVNLHDWLVGVRGGLVTGHVTELIRVDARGALR